MVIHLVISRFMMRRLQRKNVSKWLEILWNIGKQRRQELNRNKFYKKKVLFEIQKCILLFLCMGLSDLRL